MIVISAKAGFWHDAAMRDDSVRMVVLAAFRGANLLDIAGPAQVFTSASEILAGQYGCKGAYRVNVVSVSGGLVETTSGIGLMSERAGSFKPGRIDTLLVSGGIGSETAGSDTRLVVWLRSAKTRVRRFGSVCTGAFVLAGAGMLDGRRAATHWAYCDRLQAEYPAVKVERDAIFVHDGGIWTSAGITSGIDLALAMVEEDWGRDLALLVSRRLVLFLKREGGQAQFSLPLQAQVAAGRLQGLLERVAKNPAESHSVRMLAARAGMGERTLHRLFRKATGRTPADWVERMRLEAARRRLEESDELMGEIAANTGFGQADTMRRAFLRQLGVGPSAYRARFKRDRPPISPATSFALHDRVRNLQADRLNRSAGREKVPITCAK
jgi:transcriptional regulator GlxA family with amidase domain